VRIRNETGSQLSDARIPSLLKRGEGALTTPSTDDGSRNPTILVVEDDRELRDCMDLLLRDHGYEVLVAEDAAEALAQLRQNPHVRAIVLDIEMPVMNGATFRGEQLADPKLAVTRSCC